MDDPINIDRNDEYGEDLRARYTSELENGDPQELARLRRVYNVNPRLENPEAAAYISNQLYITDQLNMRKQRFMEEQRQNFNNDFNSLRKMETILETSQNLARLGKTELNIKLLNFSNLYEDLQKRVQESDLQAIKIEMDKSINQLNDFLDNKIKTASLETLNDFEEIKRDLITSQKQIDSLLKRIKPLEQKGNGRNPEEDSTLTNYKIQLQTEIQTLFKNCTKLNDFFIKLDRETWFKRKWITCAYALRIFGPTVLGFLLVSLIYAVINTGCYMIKDGTEYKIENCDMNVDTCKCGNSVSSVENLTQESCDKLPTAECSYPYCTGLCTTSKDKLQCTNSLGYLYQCTTESSPEKGVTYIYKTYGVWGLIGSIIKGTAALIGNTTSFITKIVNFFLTVGPIVLIVIICIIGLIFLYYVSNTIYIRYKKGLPLITKNMFTRNLLAKKSRKK
jgi:hypothetical protein